MVEFEDRGEQSEDDIGGNMPEIGRYHVDITHADESFEKSDAVIVTFRVLAGNKPGQVGRTLIEYFATSPKALPRLKRMAACVGALKRVDDALHVNMEDTIGRQLVIEIGEHEHLGKIRRQITMYGMWSLGNNEVADVPKDAEAMKVVAGVQPGVQASGAAPAPQQSTPQPTATPEAATEPTNKWDNI